MRRNESVLDFQRRLLKIAQQSPRLDCLKMLGIVHSNIVEFIEVRLPLEKHKDELVDQMVEVLKEFDAVLKKRFPKMYAANTPDGAYEDMQTLVDSHDPVKMKLHTEILRAASLPHPPAGFMVEGTFYTMGIIRAALQIIDDKKRGRTDSTNLFIDRVNYMGTRYRISVPPYANGDNNHALYQVKNWLMPGRGMELDDPEFRTPDEIMQSVTVRFIWHSKEPFNVPWHIEGEYIIEVPSPLLLRFSEVADILGEQLARDGIDPNDLKYRKPINTNGEFPNRLQLLPYYSEYALPMAFVSNDTDQVFFHLNLLISSGLIKDEASETAIFYYDLMQKKAKELIAESSSLMNIKSCYMTIYRTGIITSISRDGRMTWGTNDVNAAFIMAMAAILHGNAHFFIELRARGSERDNLEMAIALKNMGADVQVVSPTYHNYKVHAKICTICYETPRTEEGEKKYVNLISTGNFNNPSQKSFKDMYYFRKEYGSQMPEIKAFWEALFLKKPHLNEVSDPSLVWQPKSIKKLILNKITDLILHMDAYWDLDHDEREVIRKVYDRIIIKCNHLTDPDIICALMDAAKHGIQVDIIVRTTCTIPLNIHIDGFNVYSIAGKYLEHDRCYCFDKDGAQEVWIGSADLMSRNLYKRLEMLTQVDKSVAKLIFDRMDGYLRRDNDPYAGFFRFKLN